MRWRSILAVTVAAALAQTSDGLADAPRQGEASILYADGASLWRAPPRPDARAVEVAELGRPAAQVERITASIDGGVVLIETSSEVLVVTPHAEEVVGARALPCRPPAAISQRGDAVLCRRQGVLARVDLESPVVAVLSEDTDARIGFFGPRSDAAVVAGDEATCAVSMRTGWRRCFAPHRPDSREVLVAPSGERAVASYARGEGSALTSFRLDGRAVRRVLMSGARAIAWSADSAYLAVQRGGRACLVRATGGQYKCWRGYRAVDLAPDGQHILLARGDGPRSLYRAPLAGARPAPPRRIVERAGQGAAAWIER